MTARVPDSTAVVDAAAKSAYYRSAYRTFETVDPAAVVPAVHALWLGAID